MEIREIIEKEKRGAEMNDWSAMLLALIITILIFVVNYLLEEKRR